MFPRHRPERGGTLRDHGFWEERDMKQLGQTSSMRSGTARHRSASLASDNIVRWNTAKDLADSNDAYSQDGGSRPNSTNGPAYQGSSIPSIHVEAWDMATHPAPLDSDNRPFRRVGIDGSDSNKTSSVDVELLEAKRETRRLRRNLKESGDYLGVQGINPATGQLDVITPSESDRSSLSQETQQKLLVLEKALKDARHSYKCAKKKSTHEARNILIRNEREKQRQLDLDKKAIEGISQHVKWRRHTRQWSSAQEPNLSPIAQSRSSTAPTSRRPSRPVNEPRVQINIEPKLIDFGNDQGTAHEIYDSSWQGRTHHKDGSNAVTPGSTATVIRTSNRGSLANLTPSAWELFENGISFDNSRATIPGGSRTNDRHANDNSQRSEGKPAEMRHNPKEQPADQPESFLDKHGVVPDDSPGARTNPLHRPIVHQEDSSKRHTRQMRNFNFIRRRSSHESEQYQNRVQLINQCPSLVTKSSGERQNQQWGRNAAKRALQEPSQFLNRRLVPHINEWILKRKTADPKVARHRDDLRVKERHSFLDLGATPRMRPLQLDYRILELEATPGVESQTRYQSPKIIAAADTDLTGDITSLISPDWAASTTREVMAKCKAADEYASTPTTTTTGYDQRGPIDCIGNAREATTTPTGNQVDDTNCGRQETHISAHSSGKDATRMSPRQLPKMAAQASDDGQDSISNDRATSASSGRKEPCGNPSTAVGQNRLPSLTSTPEQGNTAKKVPEAQDTIHTMARIASKQHKSGQMSKNSELHGRLALFDEVSALVACAGAYPPIGQQRAVTCNSGIPKYPDTQCEEDVDDIWELVKGTWHKGWCHCSAIFWLYWEIVGPVFNSGSEYWIRNGRHEATWTDSFAIILALPSALIATTVFV